MSLQHAALETRHGDVEAEVAFWALLGFERVEPPPALRERAVWLQQGTAQIHLLLTHEPVAPPRGHVAVTAPDHVAALERLRAAGHEVDERARHWGAPRAFARTPAGHRVEVMAWGPAGRALPLPDPPLRGEAVALRPWTLDDVPWVTAACQDPAIVRFTRVPSPYAEDDARAFIAATAAERAAGTSLSLAAVEPGDGVPLGAIDLHGLPNEHAKGAVGYWVAPPARGRAVAARATRLLAGWALETLGLARVELLAAVPNVASQRTAERAGFRREGTLRRAVHLQEGHVDAIVFGLVAADVAPR